jgi:hypothetical protein
MLRPMDEPLRGFRRDRSVLVSEHADGLARYLADLSRIGAGGTA